MSSDWEEDGQKERNVIEEELNISKKNDIELTDNYEDINNSNERLSISDVKEMSAFLNKEEKWQKKIDLLHWKNRTLEELYEEKKKKKKKVIQLRENIPLTVSLAHKGNEICKGLIDKYSRYYRDFKEEEILGSGGFGYVMKVRDKRFDIIYALKTIKLNNDTSNKEGNYLYRRYDSMEKASNSHIMEEAIMIAKLKHEHIVRYYDAWVENNVDMYLYQEVIKPYEKELIKRKAPKKNAKQNDTQKENREHEKMTEMEKKIVEKGKSVHEKCIKDIYRHYKQDRTLENTMEEKYLYILMEYCPGKTLREAIDCGFIYKKEKVIWALCKQILKGISYIHEMKIIHRDIKPSNIFLQIQDNMLIAKIGDFGLTTRIDNKEINPSAGTVHYISPEQIDGKPFDQKADLFSLGVVFFEMFHEPFVTSMERSIVLSNLLKGIFPEYMKADAKRLKFLSCLLALNPQERPSAYNMLHENFPFSCEKDFTEIYNLVENRRNCEETHTIIRTLFEKFQHIDEEEKAKDKELTCDPSIQKKLLNLDMKIRNKGKKKIIKSFKNRGALFLVTPIILLNKYYVDPDNTVIEEYYISHSISRKKENKIMNTYMNTAKNTTVNNLIYLLDIYGNVVTLRSSFFFAISEYICHNIEHYNKPNDTNIFFKFYTYGYVYKNQVISKTRHLKKEELNNYIYPDEMEKILYTILINTRNIYEEEELYNLSVFANADVLVSLATLYECVSNEKNILFLWSYIDLLPHILHDCFLIPKNLVQKISSELRKSSSLLTNKSLVASLLQKYKVPNFTKVSDYIFNLFHLKCETNKMEEYINNLKQMLETIVQKNASANQSTFGTGNFGKRKTNHINNAGGTEKGLNFNLLKGDNNIEKGTQRKIAECEKEMIRSQDIFGKLKVFYLLEKIKKIHSFINMNTLIKNTCFDLFLNFEESVFSNEIVFYVIAENRNREIIAYGGNFDILMKKMNSNNLSHLKCYGVEINVEKIQFKIVNYSDKVTLNGSPSFVLDKSHIIKNVISRTTYLNNLTDAEPEEISQTNQFQETVKYNTKTLDPIATATTVATSVSATNNASATNTYSAYSKPFTDIQQSTTGCSHVNCSRKNCIKMKHSKNIVLNSSGRLNAANLYGSNSSKIVIHVEKVNTVLIAYDLSKKLLNNNIPSYTYLDINESHKKKNAKNYKTKNIKFLITIKSDIQEDSFDPLKPLDFNDVVYKIYNFENDEYYYLHQRDLLLYIMYNI